MEKEEIQIAGRTCWIYKAEQPDFLLAAIESLTTKHFVLVAFEVKDWQSELTPWAAPAVFGKIPFGDGAGSTLSFIIDVLMPALQKRQACDAETMKCLLGGYSYAFNSWKVLSSLGCAQLPLTRFPVSHIAR